MNFNPNTVKTLICLLLFAPLCFSQTPEFAVPQIDSITIDNHPDKSTSGKIELRSGKYRTLLGKGGFSMSLFGHNGNGLIKADYSQTVAYIDSYTENRIASYYYKAGKLFYIRLKISRTEKGKKDKEETYTFDQQALESRKKTKNIFMIEIDSWLAETNTKIITFYNEP